MMQIPDAPWIRDAEMNGMPSADPVICPVCGEEAEYIYTYQDSYEALGCDNCIKERLAWDWDEDMERMNLK